MSPLAKTVGASEDPSSSSEKSRTVAAAATATATLAATDAAVNEAVGQLQSTAQKSNDPPKLKRESGDGSKDNDDMLGGDNYAVFDLAGGTTLQITSQSPRRFMFTFPIQPKVEVKASPDEIRKVITDPILGISIL
ncbi:hypothetical protein BGX34_002433 [Mortierella sp. NVP85]|nr:hypothetical protein BGX34_002433 [Mortierella sp. NVP85]